MNLLWKLFHKECEQTAQEYKQAINQLVKEIRTNHDLTIRIHSLERAGEIYSSELVKKDAEISVLTDWVKSLREENQILIEASFNKIAHVTLESNVLSDNKGEGFKPIRRSRTWPAMRKSLESRQVEKIEKLAVNKVSSEDMKRTEEELLLKTEKKVE